MPLREFTAQELAQHDGSNPERPLLLCVRGFVYDVSPGRDFYGTDGPYSVFAGRECARALALMSTLPEDCSAEISDLGREKLQILADWEDRFQSKYEVLGTLAGSGADASRFSHQVKGVGRESEDAAVRPTGPGNVPILTAVGALVTLGASVWAGIALSGK